MTELLQGKIKFYNTGKGWGFIKRDGEDDIWFHINDFKNKDMDDFKNPVPDDSVEFTVGTDKNDRTKANCINYI